MVNIEGGGGGTPQQQERIAGVEPLPFKIDYDVRQFSHSRALKRLPDPAAIPALMNPEQRKRPGLRAIQQGDPDLKAAFHERWFAEQVENAYYVNRGTLPVHFLIQQSEEDLKFFTDPEFMPEISRAILDRGHAAYYAKRRQNELAAQAESQLAAEMERSSLAKLAGTGQPSELSDSLQDFLGRAANGIGNFFEATGAALVWGGSHFNPALSNAERNRYFADIFGYEGAKAIFGEDGMEALGYHPTAEITEAQQRIKEIQTGERRPELERVFMSGVMPEVAWAGVAESDPQIVQDYVDMYGENAYMGFAIEMQDLRDNPDIEEQTDKWIEETERAESEYLDFLEEQNFRSGSGFLEFFDTWGEVTMGAAATITAAAVDIFDDEHDGILDEIDSWGYWANLAQTVEEGGFTPSGVLGIDGTVMGFVFDITAAGLVDPTTWLIGPRGRFGANAVSSTVAAEQAMRAPATRMAMQQIPDLIASESRTSMGKAAVIASYAEVGLAGDILSASGLIDNIFPARQWLQTKRGPVTDEIPLRTVQSMLDPIQMDEIKNLTPKTVEDLRTSLRRDGFKEPVQFVWDPESQRLVLEDGGKRIAAVDAIDFEAATTGGSVRPTVTYNDRTFGVDEVKKVKQVGESRWEVQFHDGPSMLIDEVQKLNLDQDMRRASTQKARDIGETKMPVTIRVLTDDTRPVMPLLLDKPPAAVERAIEHSESKLLNQGLQRWMDEPAKIRDQINDITTGGVLPLPESTPADLATTVVNERNQARALIRWFQANKTTSARTLYRGADEMGPGGELPAINSVVEMPMVSVTDKVADAEQFGNIVYVFDQYTEHVKHPTQDMYFASGSFRVVGHQGNKVLLEDIDGSILPDIKDARAVPKGGASLDSLGIKPPVKPRTHKVENSTYIKPSHLLPEEMLGRNADYDSVKATTRQGLEMGMDAPGARSTATAVGLGALFRDIMDHTPGAANAERYLATTFNTSFVAVGGVGGVKRMLEHIQFMGAGRPEWVNHWMQRTLENQRAEAAYLKDVVSTKNANVAQLRIILNRLREAAAAGNGWNAFLQGEMKDAIRNWFPKEKFQSLADAQKLVMDEIGLRRAELAEEAAARHGVLDWDAFGKEMWDDFNRKYIATNPEWADFAIPRMEGRNLYDGPAYAPENLGFANENWKANVKREQTWLNDPKTAAGRGLFPDEINWILQMKPNKLTNTDILRLRRIWQRRQILGERLDEARFDPTIKAKDIPDQPPANALDIAASLRAEGNLVPWNVIHRTADLRQAGFTVDELRGRDISAERAAEKTKLAQAEVEKANFQGRLDGRAVQNTITGGRRVEGIELPATPVEMVAASSIGGARYTRWMHNAYLVSVRNMAQGLDAAWKANVLLGPRTFAVMSVDELISMKGELGFPFASRYTLLRADFWEARLASFFTGDFLRVGPGSRFLGAKAQERIRSLQDVPDEFRAYERMLAEHTGNQVLEMMPKDVGYQRAAINWSKQQLENSPFRKYLLGEEKFREWFDTPEGEQWVLNNPIRWVEDHQGTEVAMHRYIRDWREGWNMVELNWKIMAEQAKQMGVKDVDKFKKAWQDTAALRDGDLSGRTYAMPQWTHQYFGSIPGSRPVYPGASMAWEAAARLYEIGGANPAAFRQGLASQLVREAERKRLHALFKSQGRRVISDYEMVEQLRLRGLPPTAFDSMNAEWLDLDLAKQGVYTESYVGRLAEQRARDFVNDNTYTFEQGSRAGRIGSATVFPFGRAWGDMYGRWGRSLFSRAIMRPWTRKLGFAGTAMQKVLDYSPVNPKTLARLSRIAAADFHITGGLVGESDTDFDFSPLIFLPNAGAGGISVLIPGLGPVPILMLDRVIEMFGPDPVEDPMGYQRFIDNVARYVPGMALHGRSSGQRLAGSGNLGLVLNTVTDIAIGMFHNPNRELGRFTGNLGQELRRNRAMSAQLSDPENMNMILEQTDPEAALLLMAANWRDANQRSAQVGLADNFSSWLVPVRGALDPSLDELYEVWVRAARSHPEVFGKSEITKYSDDQLKADPDLLKQLGDSIRNEFYDLPPWQRELMIAANPTLAVNMIATWEWSDTAPQGLPDRDTAYSVSGGSADSSLGESLDRHNVYVRRGWVVPGDSGMRGHEILGRALSARQNSARTLYETAAGEMNNFLWDEIVSEESKAVLDRAVQDPFFQRIGLTDPRKLWETWNTNRDLMIDDILVEFGIERGTEEEENALEKLRGIFKVPENEQAWSTEWRGDDAQLFSDRARDMPVLLNDEARYMAGVLGINVEEGMRGEDFIAEIISYRSRSEGAAWNAVRYQYSEYQDTRGRGFAMAEQTLTDLTQNPHLNSTWRTELETFVDWTTNIADQSYHEGRISRQLQDEAVERFMRLKTSSRDAPVNWENIWRDGFQSTFGPLDWEPPEPRTPFDDADELRDETWMPYVRSVLDGDTLEVAKNKNPGIFDMTLRPEFGEGGETRVHKVRLLGVNAADYGSDPDLAQKHQARLEEALTNALRNGDSIYLVRDPDYAGSHTDPFGRELAWLWIGDEPFYFPEELERGS